MQTVHLVMRHHPPGRFDADGRSEDQKIPSPAQNSRRALVFSSYDRVQHKLLGFSITTIFLRIETR
jgi:hypothetical protein